MSNDHQTFETRTYDSAQKYLADLSPNAEIWNSNSENWIFRGQRDAEWGLMPSAFREERWEPFRGISGDMTSWKSSQAHLVMETSAVRFFALSADRQGLLVPGFDESWLDFEATMNKFIGDINNVFFGKHQFPLPSWRPLFGMAQHYGIPTRLLDWSESAKIAAYFASVEAAELLANNSIDTESFIAVWALDINYITLISRNLSERIVLVRTPWSSNPNLRAQKGLFTLHEQRLVSKDPPTLDPLEKVIQRILLDNKLELKSPILYRLRLNVKETYSLLNLLHKEGIDAASIFPGYAGVSQSLKEMRLHGSAKD